MRRRRNRNAGFTLIEMMIVVAIIGVLASAAIPMFLKYMRKARSVEGIHNVRKIADGVRAYHDAHNKMPGTKVMGTMYGGMFAGPIFSTIAVCQQGGIYPQSALNPFFTNPQYKQLADMVMFKPEGQTVRYYYYHNAYGDLTSVSGYTHALRFTRCAASGFLYHFHRMDYSLSNGALVTKGPWYREVTW